MSSCVNNLLFSYYSKSDVDGMNIDEVSSWTNFDAVKTHIENIIIKDSKVVSTKVLQHVYGDDKEDKRYRHKLKQKIQKEFFNLFNQVFSKSIFDNTRMPEFEPQSNIVSVATQLREYIISYCNTIPEHKWSPTFESVTAELGDPPDSVKPF